MKQTDDRAKVAQSKLAYRRRINLRKPISYAENQVRGGTMGALLPFAKVIRTNKQPMRVGIWA